MSRKESSRTNYGALNEEVEISAFQKKLIESSQLANENDFIAGHVLDEMQYQRETLDRAHDDLTVMQSISVSAKSMITEIQNKSNRKEVTLKVIMIGLFILDLSLILIVIKNGGSLFPQH